MIPVLQRFEALQVVFTLGLEARILREKMFNLVRVVRKLFQDKREAGVKNRHSITSINRYRLPWISQLPLGAEETKQVLGIGDIRKDLFANLI